MTAPAPPKPCPICGRPRTEKFRPFCSNRCAQRDLGKWVSGDYAIPADSAPGPDDESP